MVPMMINNSVDILTSNKVVEIMEKGVKALNEKGEEVLIEGTTVVSAFGMKANTAIAQAIDDKYHDKVTLIGDCDKVGKFGGAVHSGMYVAVTLQ